MYTLIGAITRLAFWGILAASFWTIARDWTLLMASGGWFAALGQFFAVFCTLTLMAMGLALVVGLLCLPLLIYYTVACSGPMEERSLGAWLLRFADPVWKLVWWTGWGLHRLWQRL